jgi:ubiquinone/menaquinone biosynthesis C-methylase UbiE
LPKNGNDISNSSYAANANFWIKIIREQLDRYRTELTDDAIVNATQPLTGKSVLDAGCGEGYLSRRFACSGAGTIKGIDGSDDLIEAARSAATESGLDIDYHVGSVDNLPFENNSFDIVACNHLLNDLEDIETPFGEFNRVIRDGGRLVILMLHPCFYSPHAERTPADKPLSPSEYFKIRTIEQHFRVAGITSPSPVKTWHRPLEEYITNLIKASFLIEQISEPHPSHGKMANDQWWANNFTRPLFLLITGRKVS